MFKKKAFTILQGKHALLKKRIMIRDNIHHLVSQQHPALPSHRLQPSCG
ncbi:hypothetical protein QVL58_05715 [Bartonella henselae]|nr:hypothetical protein [Bartonella henselae]